MVSRHPRYKTEICKTFHTIGTCPYGRRCRFIHNEVAPPAAPTAIGATLYNLSTMGNSTDAAELALGSEVRTAHTHAQTCAQPHTYNRTFDRRAGAGMRMVADGRTLVLRV